MKVVHFGLGKLGAPFAALLAYSGHDVTGVDVDAEVVSLLRQGKSRVDEPGLAELLLEPDVQENLSAITLQNFRDCLWDDVDAFTILVPTPSDSAGAFQISRVLRCVEAISYVARPGALVAVISTVMPAHMREISDVLALDARVDLVYAPEFCSLGSVLDDMASPFALLVGVEDKNRESALASLLELLVPMLASRDVPMHVMHWHEAAVAKIALNCALSLKPTFASLVGRVLEVYPRGTTSVDRVMSFIGDDPRIGGAYLCCGLQPSGPCLPRDVRAFLLLAKENTVPYALQSFILAMDFANGVELGQVRRRLYGLGAGQRLAALAIIGMTYKPGTSVSEEAMGVKLAIDLCARQGEVFSPILLVDPAIDRVLEDNPAFDGQDVHVMSEREAVVHADVFAYLVKNDLFEQAILDADDLTGKCLFDPWRYLWAHREVLEQKGLFKYEAIGIGRAKR